MSYFVPNPALEAELAHSAGVHNVIEEKADEAVSLAKSIAPVDTGAFRDSIHKEDGGEEGGALVVADSVEERGSGLDAAFIEGGTSFTPAHHTLLRALESLGH